MLRVPYRGLSLAVLALGLGAAHWLSAPPGASAVNDQICYAVNGAERSPHDLTVIDRLDFDPQTNETTIGPTLTRKSEALTIHPTTGALYSDNSNMTTKVAYIGTFDVTNAQFTPCPTQSAPLTALSAASRCTISAGCRLISRRAFCTRCTCAGPQSPTCRNCCSR